MVIINLERLRWLNSTLVRVLSPATVTISTCKGERKSKEQKI